MSAQNVQNNTTVTTLSSEKCQQTWSKMDRDTAAWRQTGSVRLLWEGKLTMIEQLKGKAQPWDWAKDVMSRWAQVDVVELRCHVMSALSHWDIANFLVRMSFEERVDVSANGVLLLYKQLCSLVGVICCTLTVSAHESSTGQLPVQMSSEISLSLSLVVFVLARSI